MFWVAVGEAKDRFQMYKAFRSRRIHLADVEFPEINKKLDMGRGAGVPRDHKKLDMGR